MHLSSPISKDEINSILWKACDTFRGTVDPSEYKNYILVMLFWKYVSDVWLEYRENREDIKKQPKSKIIIVVPEGADFYSIYDRRDIHSIDYAIDNAISAIENANDLLSECFTISHLTLKA
jgi:type I restriction enzyme M protein